jgi:transcriptional regulator with XRE-family HTH domain
MKFVIWFNKEFDNWSLNQPRNKRTVNAFAKTLGYSQQLVSAWLNDTQKPGTKAIDKLYEIFGDRIYEIDDIHLPNKSPLDSFPPAIREVFVRSRNEINAIYAREKVPADSPEALRIAEEVFSKYGIIINSVEKLDDE